MRRIFVRSLRYSRPDSCVLPSPERRLKPRVLASPVPPMTESANRTWYLKRLRLNRRWAESAPATESAFHGARTKTGLLSEEEYILYFGSENLSL